MAIMAMATFFACSSDGDDIEKVTLDVTAGETGGNSITFNIETSMCAQVAWMVTPTSEEQPSAADVLANGHKEEVNTTVDVGHTSDAANRIYRHRGGEGPLRTHLVENTQDDDNRTQHHKAGARH